MNHPVYWNNSEIITIVTIRQVDLACKETNFTLVQNVAEICQYNFEVLVYFYRSLVPGSNAFLRLSFEPRAYECFARSTRVASCK